MAQVFAHISVSVDGYIADDHGGLDWWSTGPEFDRYIDEMLESIDGMVFGRTAYDALAQFWPAAGPEMSATQRRRMHELPKYVLSHRPVDGAWHNSHWLEGDAVAAIQDASRHVGGDLAVFAGAQAITTALAAGVLDELRLLVHPALVGSGSRLFDAGYPGQPMRLLSTAQLGSGVLVTRYELDRTPV